MKIGIFGIFLEHQVLDKIMDGKKLWGIPSNSNILLPPSGNFNCLLDGKGKKVVLLFRLIGN